MRKNKILVFKIILYVSEKINSFGKTTNSTFKKVTGHPYLENACSNISGILFDPKGDCIFNDLFCNSFFSNSGGGIYLIQYTTHNLL
jgi:hypothetical protein